MRFKLFVGAALLAGAAGAIGWAPITRAQTLPGRGDTTRSIDPDIIDKIKATTFKPYGKVTKVETPGGPERPFSRSKTARPGGTDPRQGRVTLAYKLITIREDGSGQTPQFQGRAKKDYRVGSTAYQNLNGEVAVVAFPIHHSQRDRVGTGHMETTVTVSPNGAINATTRTWTSAVFGFTGAVSVAITDLSAKVLYQTQPRAYGVNGKDVLGASSDRTSHWIDTVPADVLDRAAGCAIVHFYAPKPRLEELIKILEGLLKDYERLRDIYQTFAERLRKPPPPTTAPA